MEMAYRERWQAEIEELRAILSGFGLEEACKWGKPCFSLEGENVVIIQGFKHYCALLFFQGAVLRDPRKLLVRPGEHTQAGRQMRFTSAGEIAANAATIQSYMREATAAAKAGRKAPLKKATGFVLPEELRRKFKEMPALKSALMALTPGRQRGYVLYFSGAKQSATRTARVEKCTPQIFAGRGILERQRH